jgi:tetratricopeptide (TPR) repeat protein
MFDLLKKIIFGKPNENDLTVHTNDISMAEMAAVQEALKGKMNDADYNNKFNQACRLVPKGKYAEAITMFEDVKANSSAPETGTCDNQIGVCHFFLGDFEAAIRCYTSSIENGFDSDMADDNIWEACEELMKKDGNKALWSQHYLSILPTGKYAKKAAKNV